jgi:hypothetical protein
VREGDDRVVAKRCGTAAGEALAGAIIASWEYREKRLGAVYGDSNLAITARTVPLSPKASTARSSSRVAA